VTIASFAKTGASAANVSEADAIPDNSATATAAGASAAGISAADASCAGASAAGASAADALAASAIANSADAISADAISADASSVSASAAVAKADVASASSADVSASTAVVSAADAIAVDAIASYDEVTVIDSDKEVSAVSSLDSTSSQVSEPYAALFLTRNTFGYYEWVENQTVVSGACNPSTRTALFKLCRIFNFIQLSS
jgi:hypothetical protein